MSRAAGAIRVVRSRARPLAPTRAPLTFTTAAIDRLKVWRSLTTVSKFIKILANEEPNNNPVFRIGLRTKGCNGMAYTLEHADIESKKKFEETVSKSEKRIIFMSSFRFLKTGSQWSSTWKRKWRFSGQKWTTRQINWKKASYLGT